MFASRQKANVLRLCSVCHYAYAFPMALLHAGKLKIRHINPHIGLIVE